MTSKRFVIGDVLGFGWRVMKANLWFFVGLILIAGVLRILACNIGTLMAPFGAFAYKFAVYSPEIVSSVIIFTIIVIEIEGQRAFNSPSPVHDPGRLFLRSRRIG